MIYKIFRVTSWVTGGTIGIIAPSVFIGGASPQWLWLALAASLLFSGLMAVTYDSDNWYKPRHRRNMAEERHAARVNASLRSFAESYSEFRTLDRDPRDECKWCIEAEKNGWK